ncbi:nuclear transport factor 2 family protein [Sphingobium phenoxybenzoativorans]|uniref:nuclear transport factor 2 family protein n=1 Tax=Sphingobium phenoxybenzoativorans TaxID=1592790 RepID=UPI000872FB74|nr:nuclear transport factor 2 family protein [Sphingobium phenoxybenzoativorans]
MSNSKTMVDERQVQNLSDREAIRQIMYAYSRAADTKDEAVRAKILSGIFVLDGTIEYGFGTWTGVSEVIGALSRMTRPYSFTHHIISNDEIEIAGDTAVARYMVTGAHGHDGRVFWAGARYTHDLVRTAEGWRLVKHKCVAGWRDESGVLPEKSGDVPDV